MNFLKSESGYKKWKMNNQGLINLPSDRKHKANLGPPQILAKIRQCGRKEEKKRDSTNTIEKTYNIFLVLNVTFYIYKYNRSYNAERFF